MLFFYHLLMFGFSFSIRMASIWSKKARLWINGRKNIFERMQYEIDPGKGPIIWMHCASLGEFEQGRPVLEAFRREYPQFSILLTFFSPSGYEVRKNTNLADWVFYLPLDGRRNANRFMEIVQPRMAIFVKYESWFHYLYSLKKRKIPSLLISAFFRKEQSFFWMIGGRTLRKMLDLYSFIFVQDTISGDLLKQYRIKTPYIITGDTRFDRVLELAEMEFHHEGIEKFVKGNKVMVAGSTWKEDEDLLFALHQSMQDLRLIIAPHEIHEKHLKELQESFEGVILYSDLQTGKEIGNAKILVIDCIGLLSKLYRFATICYVGGGFKKSGIHNILEAAVYGKVVFFGPHHKRTAEAGILMASESAYSVRNADQLISGVEEMIKVPEKRHHAEKAALDFISASKGATQRIMHHISQNLNSFH